MIDVTQYLVYYQDPGDGVRETTSSGISWRRWGSVSPDATATLVMGAFDGVHTGHRALIGWACEDAATRGEPVVVVTFAPTPKEFFSAKSYTKGKKGRIMRDSDRVAALLTTGVDAVIAFDFTDELSALTAEEFVDAGLLVAQATSFIHVGASFSFGAGGAGNADTLSGLGRERGFSCVSHGLEEAEGEAVSSTRIRQLLDEGQVEDAAKLLGRIHFVRGPVVHGRGEGTVFGFPTANVATQPLDMLPADGVYACYVEESGIYWPAAVNVGAPKSFENEDDDGFLIEAHLIGFDGDLYDREVCVHFVAWLRGQQRFDSIDELKETVFGNVDWVREHLGDTGRRISS